MALLKVKLRGKTICEAGLSKERPMLAGRKEESDIVLAEEKGISREHFQISFSEDRWVVQVLSRYGEVFHQGESKSEFVLENGSTFSLPPYEFEFYESFHNDSVNSESYGDSHSTNESGLVEHPGYGVSESDSMDMNDKTVVGVAPLVAYLKIADSSNEIQEVLKLSTGDSWLAGRDSAVNQIQIRDQRVSRKQFEIRRINSVYQVIDLGSVNGTLLNGTPISSADYTNLKSGDVIAVLDNYFYFELHDANFQNKLNLIKADHLAPVLGNENYAVDAYNPSANIGVSPYQQPMYPQPHIPYNIPTGTAGSDLPEGKGLAIFKNFDFEKNRKKLILGVVAFFVVAFVIKDVLFSGPKESAAPAASTVAAGSPVDLFNKLKPEEQALIKQRYKDAKNFYMQGRYQLAQDEIVKIHDIVPEFEDTKEIERLAKEAIYIQEQQRRQEELEKVRVETENKIQQQVAVCTKQLNPAMTSEQLEDCFAPIIAFDPEHPALQALREQVQAYTAQREAQEVRRSEYRSRVAAMNRLYEKAEAVHRKGKPLDAISAYETVVNSKLPDPNGHKAKARRSISSLRQQMNSKTAALQAEAEQAYNGQKLKAAILLLRKARVVDPTNNELPDKIEKYTTELRKQMMVLYQEGILEESYGNVEGGENKKGAKDKWKQILEMDIPDGEYYKKAFIKLKKYGG